MRLQHTLLWFFLFTWHCIEPRYYPIDLSVHVETPGVEIRAAIALKLSQTPVVSDWVETGAARCNDESVEVTQSHLEDLAVVELIELVHLGRGVVLGSYA